MYPAGMLLLVMGLPGVGKSTLARAIHRAVQSIRLESDRVRKWMAGVSPTTPLPLSYYTPDFSARVFRWIEHQTERLLQEEHVVLVDATLTKRIYRRPFVEIARKAGVPLLGLYCEAPDDVVRARLARRRGDPSDADMEVYVRMKATAEFPPEDLPYLHLRGTDPVAHLLERVLEEVGQRLMNTGKTLTIRARNLMLPL